jgi:hypothetical protein
MTERQLLGFYDASMRLEAAARANAIEDTAAAIDAALGDKNAAARPQQLRNLK